MGHTDSHCTFGLAWVNGNDSAADRLCHVSARVDRHDYNGRSPNRGKLYRIIGKVWQSVKQEHRLEHHRGSAEDLHIDPYDDPHQFQEDLLERTVVLSAWDRVENAAYKSDQATDQSPHQCEDQRIFDTIEVGGAVLGPELCDVCSKLRKLVHASAPLSTVVSLKGREQNSRPYPLLEDYSSLSG